MTTTTQYIQQKVFQSSGISWSLNHPYLIFTSFWFLELLTFKDSESKKKKKGKENITQVLAMCNFCYTVFLSLEKGTLLGLDVLCSPFFFFFFVLLCSLLNGFSLTERQLSVFFFQDSHSENSHTESQYILLLGEILCSVLNVQGQTSWFMLIINDYHRRNS